jgi:hypothetical protein
MGLCARPAWKPGLRAWSLRLALGFGPPALILGTILAFGGPDARGMFRMLTSYNFLGQFLRSLSGTGATASSASPLVGRLGAMGPIGSQFLTFLWLFPLAWLGLAGLCFAGRRKAWIGLAVALGLADLMRQRGSLEGSPYALVPLLPWFCLGLAVAAERLALFRPKAYPLLIALAAAATLPCSIDWINRLSSPPPMAKNLQNFLRSRHCEGDTVIAMPTVDWRLRQVCVPVELSQVAAARGWSGGFLPAGLSATAFSADPSLDKARYMVVTLAHFDTAFLDQNLALVVLDAEWQGWPEVFANPWCKVYENPRFGAKRDPNVRILFDPVLYRRAASAARGLGLGAAARFADARAQTSPLNIPAP